MDRAGTASADGRDAVQERCSPKTSRQLTARQALAAAGEGQFVPLGLPADVSVVVVAYNSADELPGLIESLRAEADDLRLRLIIADNDSADGTRAVISRHPDIVLIGTGGNLGYAAGINVAVQTISDEDQAILVLNPDLRVEPGAVRALWERLHRENAGITVPRLLNVDGSFYPSLRREPSLPTAVGEALFGSHWARRPQQLAEVVHDPAVYSRAHRIDWATGAALMIRRSLARSLGDWDERFFLYSEEVDYFRRARAQHETIWFEPAALMRHIGGASGASIQLEALMAVNRIRYIRKYHRAPYAQLFRQLVLLREALRAYRQSNRRIWALVSDESSWQQLPGPQASRDPDAVLKEFPPGAIIIPAHNEAAVIARTLKSLAPIAATGAIEVIVACNGCTDQTAQIARQFESVKVIEASRASKTVALNEGDATATLWPRLYLDADISITATAVRMVFQHLADGRNLAARPAFVYDDGTATWPVRAFYRARRRLPSTAQALWGAGAYALSREGHTRFGAFPDVTGDDLFVDLQFLPQEKDILATPPVQVLTPRDTRSLLKILRRNYRGDAEFATLKRDGNVSARVRHNGTKQTVLELVQSVTGPRSLRDALVYASLVSFARRRPSTADRGTLWERDESSRT
ncbi:glycosyltransferase family 2 protein [Glutamicibacter arilaitensis]|uniref:glycosyltransferase family 2 protein n=1 Tax=Glutamicibacter arilaitensis TaxID=256701 RepID=UPI003FD3C18F